MENDIQKGKTAAVVSYLTLVGSIIAIFMNQDESKSDFASFHIRQGLGIFVSWLLLGYFVGSVDNWIISGAFYVMLFMLWIFGFIGVLNNEKRLMPIVGEFYQKIFKNF